jgi:hypothetical protein
MADFERPAGAAGEIDSNIAGRKLRHSAPSGAGQKIAKRVQLAELSR